MAKKKRINQTTKADVLPSQAPEQLKPRASLDQNLLAIAAIHATLLAIFLGVLSTYGFYKRTLRDQLETKILQEANEINAIRFQAPDYIPEQAIIEAKQLAAQTPRSQLVERLRGIISKGETVNLNHGVDNAVADQGRKAFHLMLAILFHSPFPSAIESRRDPIPVSLPNIATIRSWVVELEQVTIPLIRAYESAVNGLHNVLRMYALQEQQIDFSAFSTPFVQSLNAAHGIIRQVKARLQEFDGYEKSAPGQAWLLVGFLGASLTFVIGVLMPLLNSPISHKLIQWRVHLWEPTTFYLLTLMGIAYLIFVA